MKHIKFDSCREVLTSGNVLNCYRNSFVVQVPFFRAKQMFEDFEVESLAIDIPYKGKSGDYIMISPTCEIFICGEKSFGKIYTVTNFFDIRQFATNLEDYHFGIGHWQHSPFNDEALEGLRSRKIVIKEIVNSTDYIKTK